MSYENQSTGANNESFIPLNIHFFIGIGLQ